MKRIILISAVFFTLAVGLSERMAFADDNQKTGWRYKLGVDERFRFEHKQDFDFDERRDDNGGLIYNRLKLNAKAVWGDEDKADAYEVFVEGLDLQVGSYQTKSNLGQKDELDLYQGYVRLNKILDSDFSFKIGRQSLDYGAGRIIGAPAWSNRMRSFDAAVAKYADENGYYADVLYGQTVNYDDHNFNKSKEDEKLIGIYGGHKKEKGPLCEAYFFSLLDNRTSTETKRYTVGLRHSGKAGELFDFDIEVPYQFGTQGSLDISAYAVHVDVSRKFEDLLWDPKFILEYNLAGGDRDPNDGDTNTFIPLYQGTHSANGIMDILRWQNMQEVALHSLFTVTEKMKLRPQLHFFWLDSEDDSYYNTSGTAVRTQTSGERDRYFGSEVSLVGNYDICKYAKLEAGIAHFFAGGYLADTGGNEDADFVYSQFVLKY